MSNGGGFIIVSETSISVYQSTHLNVPEGSHHLTLPCYYAFISFTLCEDALKQICDHFTPITVRLFFLILRYRSCALVAVIESTWAKQTVEEQNPLPEAVCRTR